MKRLISLWLPTFPTDQINRKSPGKSQYKAYHKKKSTPLVTTTSTNGTQWVVNSNKAALAIGILPNQPLADARAVFPSLGVYRANYQSDMNALGNLRSICEKYTPWVSIDEKGGLFKGNNLWGFGLWLNVTGCIHLFGGEKEILYDLFSLLRRMGYTARAGLASTTGAAWAIARYKTDFSSNPCKILGKEECLKEALASLPIESLRLSNKIIEDLEKIGIRCIRDLYKIPRASLVYRFGEILVKRLDQALGKLDEPISPGKKPPDFIKRLFFSEPVTQREYLEAALSQLLFDICVELENSEKGVRQLILRLYQVDDSIFSTRIGSSQATRDRDHLKRLCLQHLDKIDFGFGVEAMVVIVSEVNVLSAYQTQLSRNLGVRKIENTRKLIDRLAVRFGTNNITFLRPVERHFPELATEEIPALFAPNRLKKDWEKLSHAPIRPLLLLTKPLPIEVTALAPDGPPIQLFWGRKRLKITLAEGPERITPEWWQDTYFKQKIEPILGSVRDYYRIESETGQRYWLYRDGMYQNNRKAKWYIHGFFP